MSEHQLSLRIFGRVQGVGFRFRAEETAKTLGLTGWIKNCPDGAVEALVEGAEADLKNFLAWCYNGSKSAAVEKVAVDWRPAQGKFQDFEIIS